MKHRKNTYRCPKWNYSSPGTYIVTINTKNRSHDFGEVVHGIMELNEFGKLVAVHWQRITDRFRHVILDDYVVMPDHMHGILRIGYENNCFCTPMGNYGGNCGGDDCGGDCGGDCRGVPTERPYDNTHHDNTHHINSNDNNINDNKSHQMSIISPRAKSISVIIRNFKADCTKSIRLMYPEFQWQRNFHDRIVRNSHELNAYRRYIQNNPMNWNR